MPAAVNIPVPTVAQLRPYTCEAGKLARLLAVLAELDAGPATPAAYRRAAVWLDKNVEPQDVEERNRMMMPRWCMFSWIERLWADANEHPHAAATRPADPPRYPWDPWRFWDHRWGSIKVFGVSVLVTEPYGYEEDSPAWTRCGDDSAPAVLREIGRRLGGVGVWTPRSVWGHGAARFMFFPAPSAYPAVLAPRWMRCYYQPDLLPRCELIAYDMRGARRPTPESIRPRVRLLV